MSPFLFPPALVARPRASKSRTSLPDPPPPHSHTPAAPARCPPPATCAADGTAAAWPPRSSSRRRPLPSTFPPTTPPIARRFVARACRCPRPASARRRIPHYRLAVAARHARRPLDPLVVCGAADRIVHSPLVWPGLGCTLPATGGLWLEVLCVCVWLPAAACALVGLPSSSFFFLAAFLLPGPRLCFAFCGAAALLLLLQSRLRHRCLFFFLA